MDPEFLPTNKETLQRMGNWQRYMPNRICYLIIGLYPVIENFREKVNRLGLKENDVIRALGKAFHCYLVLDVEGGLIVKSESTTISRVAQEWENVIVALSPHGHPGHLVNGYKSVLRGKNEMANQRENLIINRYPVIENFRGQIDRLSLQEEDVISKLVKVFLCPLVLDVKGELTVKSERASVKMVDRVWKNVIAALGHPVMGSKSVLRTKIKEEEGGLSSVLRTKIKEEEGGLSVKNERAGNSRVAGEWENVTVALRPPGHPVMGSKSVLRVKKEEV